ncbi:protein of unknown function [Bradyrhizobium vignae]|uniref:Uncharacterized protein n=1 Tax=Bradyrhizobium vignae TaxID=1549949 RepID=A0A2U3Q5U5_9BRAD|nr:protein of unknown function [Bradyrhizobium vignae]
MMLFCLKADGPHHHRWYSDQLAASPVFWLAMGHSRPGRAGSKSNQCPFYRSMQVRSTSFIGLPHQSLEKISISE